ncbi:cytochrome P450 (plasmid) [Rhodococcus sp. USK10]|uniref:cytochrome P450 n=1 Tax=Rhodococcus sp. USK10 TaxID=2789739 RepID=UPI001C5EB44F|nr:cytochrome P450 [Rhodococcus sp. USK10]QYB00107.1 cytochrome P450 [Rhodococcus sp. USK10]
MTTSLSLPNSDIDPFSDEALADPYPYFQQLRDLGPLVELTQHNVVALSRHAQVVDALTDSHTFSSADGVGLNDVSNSSFEGTLIATDPPEHARYRAVLAERLAPRSLREMKADIEDRVDRHVEDLVSRGSFDAITDLARAVPVAVVLDLLGFPPEGRDQLLGWAERFGDINGPANERMQAALPAVDELFGWLATTCTRDRMIPGGFATTIHEAAERGDIPEEAVVPLMSSYALPAMDTTISALGSAIQLFVDNPDQWEALRENPALIPGAFNEVIRLESPIQAFSRVTRRTYTTEGFSIPENARVVIFYGAANRDERKYADPDRFDVRRQNVDHVAFGLGTHACPGQGLARMEAHAVLHALTRHVRAWESAGEPRRRFTNITRSLDRLPVVAHR